jgi:hypothetical protein
MIQIAWVATAIDLTYMLRGISTCLRPLGCDSFWTHLKEAVSTHTPNILARHTRSPPSSSKSLHGTVQPGPPKPTSLAMSTVSLVP